MELDQSPIVTIKQGKLQGTVKKDYAGGEYFSFKGIPYAKPPVGELRFKAPHPAEPWYGVLDASNHRDICFQRHMLLHTMVGSEDCLYVNVYTPELPNENNCLKPVMVWIHGGFYTTGSGDADLYGPEFLIPHNVVVVTLNYRLGLLGFINFEDASIEVPGNAGFKDQVMALKWVEENICAFGGNPNNITIFGESAGAWSVHALVLSPMAKGLFHKAIIQSGTVSSVWAAGRQSTPVLAKALGLESASEREVYDIVKNMSKENLFKLQTSIEEPFLPSTSRLIGAVVEKNSYEPKFLPQDPLEIMTSGKYNQVPTIFGYCSREGMLGQIYAKLTDRKYLMEGDFKLHVPLTLHVHDPKTLEEIGNKIQKFYFANQKPSLKSIDQYYVMDTDNFFLRSLIRSIKNHLNTATAPIYLYKLSLDSSLNIFKKMMKIETPGVCHSDDVGYLFKNSFTPEVRLGSIEDEAMNRMTKLWTNFARFGNPNPKEQDPLIPVPWKPTEKDMLHFLNIDENLSLGANPEFSRMQFWDDIFGPVGSTSKL